LNHERLRWARRLAIEWVSADGARARYSNDTVF